MADPRSSRSAAAAAAEKSLTGKNSDRDPATLTALRGPSPQRSSFADNLSATSTLVAPDIKLLGPKGHDGRRRHGRRSLGTSLRRLTLPCLGSSEQTHMQAVAAPRDRETIKILLLGPSNSGKSTLYNQMRLLYTKDEFQRRKLGWRAAILENLLGHVQAVYQEGKTRGWPFSRVVKRSLRELSDLKDRIYRWWELVELPAEALAPLRNLRDSESWRRALQTYSLTDTSVDAFYFMDILERLFDGKYAPSTQDVLNTRLKTTGIVETAVDVGGDLRYRVFDLGGARAERKKWIHAFDSVDVVVFHAPLGSFNERVDEGAEASQLDEALELFASIANLKWFTRTLIVLNFTKSDCLRRKLAAGVKVFTTKQQTLPDTWPDKSETVANVSAIYADKFLRAAPETAENVVVTFADANDVLQAARLWDLVEAKVRERVVPFRNELSQSLVV
ncbi:G-protein alpha subunit-domain-containing protein [Lasiosphaeria miniovina]|uniref:G-protein alpha subunit-domain-containing protein n=1 Tax=Lasiosphaeria miniovina TaxID=1954250 RepID=A0AA39ZZD0_9PEZI|nr:G-protein alpha subunit-domain-containing protein [Lasiosphaeria miniovina]KAK0706194.1 G-protein alpha subunit-domain-containing protein [Lasiosphaeria miniovina]